MKKNILLFVYGSHVFAILGLSTILILASVFQFLYNELPCPLCLLQRVGYFTMIFGFLLNLRLGFKSHHYTLIIFACLLTASIAGRQILLHIIPGTGAYGDPFLGLHLYTWSFIFAMITLIGSAVLLAFQETLNVNLYEDKKYQRFIQLLFFLVALLLILNVVSSFLECGFKACPENPVYYELLH